MRSALGFALRRGVARTLLGVGVLGGVWTGLERAYPWARGHGVYVVPPGTPTHALATGPWDVVLAVAGIGVGVGLAVLVYRRRPIGR